MGNYTTFKADLTINIENKQVVNIISSLMHPNDYFGPVQLDRPKIGMVHEFFVTDRATCIFSDMNYAFANVKFVSADEIAKIIENDPSKALEYSRDDLIYGVSEVEYFDKSSFNPETGFLKIRSCFKNYDNEINKFIDWITPYLKKEEVNFASYQCESDLHSTDLILTT